MTVEEGKGETSYSIIVPVRGTLNLDEVDNGELQLELICLLKEQLRHTDG